MKNRIRYFDIAKGIAILCVIAGHLGIEGINSVVFTFHMPLFFLISGYFLSDKTTISEFVERKIWQLIVPYMLTVLGIIFGDALYRIIVLHKIDGIFEMTVNWIKAGLYGSGTIYNPTLVEVGQIGAIWFLLASFVAVVEVRILSQYKYGILVIAFLAYWAYKSAMVVWLPLDIQAGFAAAVFVYVGKKFREYEIFEKEIPKYILVPGIGIWGYIILGGTNLGLVQAVFPNGILDFIGAIIGSYVIINFSKKIDRYYEKIARILEYYGNNTLIILWAHIIELSIVPWDEKWIWLNSLGIPYILQVWIILMVKILWATIWVVLINRIPLISDIFHGKGIGGNKVKLFEKTEEQIQTKGIGVFCIIIGKCFQGNVFITMAGIMLLLFDDEWMEYDFKGQCKIVLMVISTTICSGAIGIIENTNNNVEEFAIALSVGLVISVVISRILKKASKEELIVGICFGIFGIIVGQIYGKTLGNIDYSLIIAGILIVGRTIRQSIYSKRLKKQENIIENILFSTIIIAFAVKYQIYFDMSNREYSYLPMCIVVMLAMYVLGKESVNIISVNKIILKCIRWLDNKCWVLLGIYIIESSFCFWKEKVFEFLPIEKTVGRETVVEIFAIVLVTGIIDKLFFRKKTSYEKSTIN